MSATDAAVLVDAVLVAAGPLTTGAEARLRAVLAARPGGLLVGVDGGAATLAALGLFPHLVTGDGDSLSEAARNDLAKCGARIVPTPDQNFTDLDKAVAYVLETGARVLRVFGATGGRLDHTYSALSVLLKHTRARPDADLRLVDEWGETLALNTFVTLSGPDLPGRVLSLLALGPVSDVRTTGVRWPLSGEALAPGVRDGTLNEVTETVATIRAGAGDLLVVLGHAALPAAALTPVPSPNSGRGVPVTDSSSASRGAREEPVSGTPLPELGEGTGVRADDGGRP